VAEGTVRIPCRDARGLITKVIEAREDDALVHHVEELETALRHLETTNGAELEKLREEIAVRDAQITRLRETTVGTERVVGGLLREALSTSKKIVEDGRRLAEYEAAEAVRGETGDPYATPPRRKRLSVRDKNVRDYAECYRLAVEGAPS